MATFLLSLSLAWFGGGEPVPHTEQPLAMVSEISPDGTVATVRGDPRLIARLIAAYQDRRWRGWRKNPVAVAYYSRYTTLAYLQGHADFWIGSIEARRSYEQAISQLRGRPAD